MPRSGENRCAGPSGGSRRSDMTSKRPMAESTTESWTRSTAAELDAHAEAGDFLATLPTLEAPDYDLRRLHEALQADVEALTEVWHLIKDISAARDAKLQRLKELLAGALRGKKVLLFTY